MEYLMETQQLFEERMKQLDAMGKSFDSYINFVEEEDGN